MPTTAALVSDLPEQWALLRSWTAAATRRLDLPTAVGKGAVRPCAVSDGTPDLTDSLSLL